MPEASRWVRFRSEFAVRLRAVLRQRCPQCLEGKVFSGIITMRASCARCGHRFEREQGYFQGAMYLSYVMAVFVLLVMIGIGVLFAPVELALLVVLPLFLVVVPMVFRYSRIVWMHVNVWAF